LKITSRTQFGTMLERVPNYFFFGLQATYLPNPWSSILMPKPPWFNNDIFCELLKVALPSMRKFFAAPRGIFCSPAQRRSDEQLIGLKQTHSSHSSIKLDIVHIRKSVNTSRFHEHFHSRHASQTTMNTW